MAPITSTTHGNLTNTTSRLPHPPARVLSILHNHARLLALNPLATKVVRAADPAGTAAGEAVFTVTEHVLLLGCVPTTTTHRATLSNQKNGVWVSFTHATMGVETSSVWMVEADRETRGGAVVTESFELVRAPWWVRRFVRRAVKEARKTTMERLAMALEEDALAEKK